jgi:uncharacterized membrane protein YbaN (DUF454 family)
MSCGYLLLGVGVAGFFIPGLPGTIFLILALGCFKKGSPGMERWMLANKQFGPILCDWDENGWISARVKVISVSCILLFGLGSLFSLKDLHLGSLTIPVGAVMGLVLSLVGYGVWFILSRPTKPEAVVSSRS